MKLQRSAFLRTSCVRCTKNVRHASAVLAVVLSWVATSAAAAGCNSSSDSGASDAASGDVATDTVRPPDGPPADAADAASSDGPLPEADPARADAGATDADGGAPFEGEAGPPSLCPGSTFLFCDGFEQNLTNWTGIASTGGEVSVDSAHVYRGTKAMHADIYAIADAGATAYAMVQRYGSEPWPTHFFTRFFAYVPSPAPPSTAGLLDLIENAPPYSGTELRLVPPDGALGMQTYGTSAGLVTWQSAAASSPLDQWVCFEVEVDTGAETEHVYVNDAEVTDLMRSGLTLPQLGNVGVGLGFYQPNVHGVVEAWIDEVAVDSARIGCAN